MTNKLLKFAAFTLSEVLVALTVVGIVSALTVPNLLNKSTKKTQAALIHKAYVDLSDAVELYMNEEDKKSTYPLFSSLDKINTFFVEYLRVNKNCNSAPSGECLSADYRSLQGTTYNELGPYGTPTNYSCVQNKAGITYCMAVAESPNNFEIWIDTNGTAEPNMKGRDIFTLYMTGNGDLVDFGTSLGDYTARETNFTTYCNVDNGHPAGCIGRLMNSNWQMDY